jgi:hypothetical protein
MSSNKEELSRRIIEISRNNPSEVANSLICTEIDLYINDSLFALGKLLKETRKMETDTLVRYKLKAKHEIIDQLLMYGFGNTYSKIEGATVLRQLIEEDEKKEVG